MLTATLEETPPETGPIWPGGGTGQEEHRIIEEREEENSCCSWLSSPIATCNLILSGVDDKRREGAE